MTINTRDGLPRKIATIRLTDNVNCLISGLSQDLYAELFKKFGFFKKGYIFSPLYKLGRWDGKIRLCSKNGRTSINFLSDIIPIIKARGYKVSIVDERPVYDLTVPEIDETYLSDHGITLGQHQVDCVNAVTANGGGIILAGTGSGKTYMTAALCKLYEKTLNYRCLVMVPTLDLVNQTHEEIRNFSIDVGILSGNSKDLSKPHLVSTWQSLKNIESIISNYQVIIVDEGHSASADVMHKMLNTHGAKCPVRIGLTGTLPKEEAERMQVHYVLGQVVHEVAAHELIDQGWLAKLNLEVITLEEDFSAMWEKYKLSDPEEASKLTYAKFKKEFFPDYTSEKAHLSKQTERLEFVADFARKRRDEAGNTLIMVNGREVGKRLSKLIDGAIFIDGTDNADIRKNVYSMFDQRDDLVLITTMQLVSTGLNIKRIMNIVALDANKAFIQIIQSIGRGLRKASDKDSVNYYDISSDTKYATKHRNTRKGYYDESRYTFTTKKINYKKLLDDILAGMVY